MKSTFVKSVLGICLPLAVALVSCEKDGGSGMTSGPAAVVTVNDLPADTIVGIGANGQPFGAGRFTFFSLERNETVPVSDSNSTRWDLGFRGTTIITNSGNSGPGRGGAFVFVGLFDDLKAVPTDSAFRVDNAPSNLAIPNGSGRAWYVYNPQANLVTAIPGRVLMVRTASGRFAKLEILNYYKGGVTPSIQAPDDEKIRKQRFYRFRYVYQPSGGMSF
jgi:hypothetical protein